MFSHLALLFQSQVPRDGRPGVPEVFFVAIWEEHLAIPGPREESMLPGDHGFCKPPGVRRSARTSVI